jgi:hypothetical protein
MMVLMLHQDLVGDIPQCLTASFSLPLEPWCFGDRQDVSKDRRVYAIQNSDRLLTSAIGRRAWTILDPTLFAVLPLPSDSDVSPPECAFPTSNWHR